MVYNRGPGLVAACSVFLGATWTFTLLRCYVRKLVMNEFGRDDFAMVLGQVFFTVSVACTIVLEFYGLGLRTSDIPLQNFQPLAKWQYIISITYPITAITLKLSICFFYNRLVVGSLYKTIVATVTIASTVGMLCCFFMLAFVCLPVQKNWDPTIKGHCLPSETSIAVALAISGITVVTDFFFAVLPIPLLWEVNIKQKSKFIVYCLLGLGVTSSAATLARLKYIIVLRDGNYSDPFSLIWIVLLCTMIEPGLCIITACAATLRPLLYRPQDSSSSIAKTTRNFGSQSTGSCSRERKSVQGAEIFSSETSEGGDIGADSIE